MVKSPKFEPLTQKLALKFKNEELLNNAFVHRSYLNEHKDYKGPSNERLEFLGDSVLSIIVSRFLFEKLPKMPEGKLTMIRAALVRTETLARLARELNLGEYLFLAKGEEESGGRSNRSILANTFEALVGAIYLDMGLDAAQSFIEKVILARWQTLTKNAVSDNKSRLQEVVQRRFHMSPLYKVMSSWGPDHARLFEIGVYLGGELLGKGVGKNKQESAQNAANDALNYIKTKKS